MKRWIGYYLLCVSGRVSWLLDWSKAPLGWNLLVAGVGIVLAWAGMRLLEKYYEDRLRTGRSQ